MTNAYYHEFTIGFNFWYIFIPLSLVVMYFIGKSNLFVKNGKRYRKFNDRFYRFCSVVFSLMTAILVSTESGHGLVQVLDNGLSRYDDPTWSVFGAIIVISAIALFEAMACFALGKIGESVKKEELTNRRKKTTNIRYRKDEAIL